MQFLRIITIAAGLIFLAGDAWAEDTIIQIGTWGPCSGGPFGIKCPPVTFGQAFGAGTPTRVFLSFNRINVQTPPPNLGMGITISLSASAVNITPNGFLPLVEAQSGGTVDSAGGNDTGTWVAIGPRPPAPPVAGIVKPKYVVLLVAYAPPGTDGGKSTSSVVYEGGSSAGTTSSVSNSFKQNYSIAADSGAGLIGNEGGAGLSFSYARTATSEQTLDIKKSSISTTTVPGPSVDGISHDRDLIYLWLNPQINLALTSTSAVWTFTGTTVALIKPVYAGWLKNPSCKKDDTHPTCIPDEVRNDLKKYSNITEDDFSIILQHDVLAYADGSSALDPNRFVSLNSSFSYNPPYSQNDPAPTYKYTQTSNSNSTITSKIMDDYTILLSIYTQGNFFDLAKASLKNTDTWNWTNSSSQSASTGTSEAATVTVGGPSFKYSGPTDVGVYYDTLYKTFAFNFITGPVA